MILLTCGFITEARTATSRDIHPVPGGDDATYLATELDRLAPDAEAIVSWGLAGALRDDLNIGDWVIGSGVSGGFEHDCDSDWVERVAAAFPGAHTGRFHADGHLADAPAKRILGLGGRIAVDMESHIAARVGPPTGCRSPSCGGLGPGRRRDAAGRAGFNGAEGRTAYARVAASLARHPGAGAGLRGVRAAQHRMFGGAQGGADQAGAAPSAPPWKGRGTIALPRWWRGRPAPCSAARSPRSAAQAISAAT